MRCLEHVEKDKLEELWWRHSSENHWTRYHIVNAYGNSRFGAWHVARPGDNTLELLVDCSWYTRDVYGDAITTMPQLS
jgi:hypothetical protein